MQQYRGIHRRIFKNGYPERKAKVSTLGNLPNTDQIYISEFLETFHDRTELTRNWEVGGWSAGRRDKDLAFL